MFPENSRTSNPQKKTIFLQSNLTNFMTAKKENSIFAAIDQAGELKGMTKRKSGMPRGYLIKSKGSNSKAS